MIHLLRSFQEFSFYDESIKGGDLPEGRVKQCLENELSMSEVIHPVCERLYEVTPSAPLPKGKILRNLSLAAKLIESSTYELAGEISTETLKELVGALAVVSQLRDELEG